jgi:hypothetical protein
MKRSFSFWCHVLLSTSWAASSCTRVIVDAATSEVEVVGAVAFAVKDPAKTSAAIAIIENNFFIGIDLKFNFNF